ncbi:ATP-binding protein [Paenibacillus thalictri]|uniref:histidine kinase n=1 Tax=Paenibacillus thalictri TaxID=2527873 RepID=A0A4Q9DME8_9BACL|nr:ATP-binding protein [Paenibacillus thalictri]TBL76510.1 hypothetical protein EYB31_18930 [Paenibacillus thalictri]
MRALTLWRIALLIALFWALTLVQGAYAPAEAPQAAQQGVFDATGWHAEWDGELPLDGEWEFYWNQLLEPDHFQKIPVSSNFTYVTVPKEWHSYTLDGRPLPYYGYATYRLRLNLGSEELHKRMALYISGIDSAYRLWINGSLASSNGTVGTNKISTIPRSYAQVVTFTPDQGEVELVLQVAGFEQRKAGVWSSIRLGSEQHIVSEWVKHITLEIALAASLGIMGFYHLVIFLFRQKDRSPLFLGLLCLAIAIRTLCVGEALVFQLFPFISWECGTKMEYLCAFLGIALLVALAYSQYPHEMNRSLYKTALGGSLSGALVVIFTSSEFYTRIMLPIQLWIMICFGFVAFVYFFALLKRKEAAGFNCGAIFLLVAAGVNDTLYYNHVIATGDVTPFALVGALFIQAFIFSRKFARSFKQEENLSRELTLVNESLEEKIRKRTSLLSQSVFELQKANDELSQLETSRRQLMSGISHELGTPLTSIQGYVNAMKDGIIDPGNPKYLDLIYGKTVYLDRIIGDLVELSKLEARQMAFHFETLPAEGYFRYIYEKYEPEFQSDGKILEWHNVQTIEENLRKDDRIVAFTGDPLRLEQVVSNLLTNARKFTEQGGIIRMELHYEHVPGTITLRVADTGEGISEEDLPFVFEQFYRGKQAKRQRTAGMGLGLAIAKEIIQAHGGTIGVESAPGKGSLFYFKLQAGYELFNR